MAEHREVKVTPDRYVTYRYAGQTYHALMNYRPGRTMRVMVQVRPQFERGMASRY